MQKKTFSCELAMALGILINSFSLSLLVKSSFGISTLSSVPLAMSEVFPGLSFGTWNTLIQVLTMLVLILLTRNFRLGYLLSFVIAQVFGLFIDCFDNMIAPWPTSFGWCVLYFLVGFFAMAFGASLFLNCRLPVLPFDTFVREMTQHYSLPVKVVKTTLDLVYVGITLLLSLLVLHRLVGIGVGTILGALFTGLLTSRICDWLTAHYVFKPVFSMVIHALERADSSDTKQS